MRFSRTSFSLALVLITLAAPAQTADVITSWAVQDNILTTAVREAGAVIVGSDLYIVGGSDGADTDEVWRLPIGAQLGAEVSETALPATNNFAYIFEATVATAEHIYISGGGWNSSVPTLWDRVHHIAVNPDGSLAGAWSATSAFPNSYVAQLGGAVISASNYLYCFSGADDNASTFFNDCYYAQINPDGSLGAWQTGTSLPDARWFLGSCAVGDYLIVAPGASAFTPTATDLTTDILVCQVNTDGTMGSWTVQTEKLPGLRYGMNLEAFGNTIFAIGGRDESRASADNVWRATFDPGTGIVGAWSQVDAQLPAAIHYHDVALSAVSNRLYVVGMQSGTVLNQAYISTALVTPPVTGVLEWSLYR